MLEHLLDSGYLWCTLCHTATALIHVCSFTRIEIWFSFSVLASMAESDRSRSPVPARNRLDPRGQHQPLPFFPRWCGPMSSAVRHLNNMPRPQTRPSWQSGPYMMGRIAHQLGTITTVSVYSTKHSSTTYLAISTTSSMSTNTTVSTDTTLLTHGTVDFSISATPDQHSKFWSSTQDGQQRSRQSLRL